ncbi:MAG TPA: DUF2505 family protein [Polyangiaceae bacterium]
MNQTIRHSFDVGESAFWKDVFFDHGFVERMYKEALGCISVTFLEDTGDASEARTRRLSFTQKFDAPGPIRKLFGDTTTMEERGRFDPRTKRWRFTMVPDRMADKIKIAGETWVEPKGDSKIERVMSLEYGVSIFGIGGLVEKFMASATEDSFEKQARFTREYLQKR